MVCCCWVLEKNIDNDHTKGLCVLNLSTQKCVVYFFVLYEAIQVPAIKGDLSNSFYIYTVQ